MFNFIKTHLPTCFRSDYITKVSHQYWMYSWDSECRVICSETVVKPQPFSKSLYFEFVCRVATRRDWKQRSFIQNDHIYHHSQDFSLKPKSCLCCAIVKVAFGLWREATVIFSVLLGVEGTMTCFYWSLSFWHLCEVDPAGGSLSWN